MSSDDSSELSEVPSDVEADLQLTKKDGILKFFSKVPAAAPEPPKSPPRPKRGPSPDHEYVLADNSDIAVSHHNYQYNNCPKTRRKRVNRACDLC